MYDLSGRWQIGQGAAQAVGQAAAKARRMSLCDQHERTVRGKRRHERLTEWGWTSESIAAWRAAAVDPWTTAEEYQIRAEMERRLVARGWLPQERHIG